MKLSVTNCFLLGMEKTALSQGTWNILPRFMKRMTYGAMKSERIANRGDAIKRKFAQQLARHQAIEKTQNEARKKSGDYVKNAIGMAAAIPLAGGAALTYGAYKNRNSFDVNRIAE